MKSILQTRKYCYNCGTEVGLHLHHCIYGTCNRKISDQNGFTCYLCWKCHNNVHNGGELGNLLKMACQKVYELDHTRDEWMKLIGRNYLEE